MAKAKLTDEQWVELFSKLDTGAKVADLAKEYGLTRQAIYFKKRNRKGMEVNG